MNSTRPSSGDGNSRILPFRYRRTDDRKANVGNNGRPVADLSKYERSAERDDHRHRMLTNAAAFVVVALLIAAGLWLANSLAQIRKNQDCALSGRRNCAPIEVNRDRW